MQVFSPAVSANNVQNMASFRSMAMPQTMPQTMTGRLAMPMAMGQAAGMPAQAQMQAQPRAMAFLQMTNAPMTSAQNINETLSQMRLPLSEGNVSLATSMTENGITLSKENFTSLKSALAQLPPETSQAGTPSSRVGATWFLTQNQLPVTGQNVALLSNFLASHPQLGQQLFNLKKGVGQSISSVDRGAMGGKSDALAQLSGMIGEMVLEAPQKRGSAKGRGKLMNMAKQFGIETHLALVGNGEQDWELLALMRAAREEMAASGRQASGLAEALNKFENNVNALRLMNNGRPNDETAFYYMQIPLRQDREDTANVWIRYHVTEDGERVVDGNDTHLDFSIFTEHLGELRCSVSVFEKHLFVDVCTEFEPVRQLISQNLVVLTERLRELGWTVERARVSLQGLDTPPLLGCQESVSMEPINVQA